MIRPEKPAGPIKRHGPERKTNRNKIDVNAGKSVERKPDDDAHDDDPSDKISRPVTNQDEQRQITNAGNDQPIGEAEREGD
ncbi:MAG TPA: hypothetical protein VD927_16890 [Chryseosolibacter sp.]|nr:hypothetical protein [Chryseosolibacter sp.]